VRLTTFEILLTIVAPMLALYLRGRWPLRTVTACTLVIAAAWYLACAPVHELSHATTAVLSGGRVLDVKLIPSFWEGTLAVAWVTTAGLDQPWQQLAMGGAPYAVDVACVAAGLAVVRPRLSGSALVVGLLFMLRSCGPPSTSSARRAASGAPCGTRRRSSGARPSGSFSSSHSRFVC
jgi:hypothetical protein